MPSRMPSQAGWQSVIIATLFCVMTICNSPISGAIADGRDDFQRRGSRIPAAVRMTDSQAPSAPYSLAPMPVVTVTHFQDDVEQDIDGDDSSSDSNKTNDSIETNDGQGAGFWPQSQQLQNELDQLLDHPQSAVVKPVVEEIKVCLSALHHNVPAGHPDATILINRLIAANGHLKTMLHQQWRQNGNLETAQLTNQLGRINYQLQRRLVIWTDVNERIRVNPNLASPKELSQPTMMLPAGHRSISFAGIDASWSNYLLLDEVESAFNSMTPDQRDIKNAARRSLARIYSPSHSRDQSQYIRRSMNQEDINWLKAEAHSPIDYQKFLASLERFEFDPDGVNGYIMNDYYQNLMWSNNASEQKLAAELNTHYRNANARLAISEVFLNRLIPQMPSTAEPFSDNVMGAKVSGQNNISNQVQVQLIPDPNQVQLQLNTLGQVHSNTVARRDGFTIRNQGMAKFQVFKRLAINRDGIDSSENPVAYSTADQRLVGLESEFDSMPIVGWIARKVAHKKIQEQAPETTQMVKKRVANDASNRMQETVEAQLVKMRQFCHNNLLQPLMALDLEPEPVQMATSDQQIIMRYRLAGRDQMAAHTARPSDDPLSLLSMQLHQSTINNAVSRIGLNGEKFNIDELTAHIHDVLGITGKEQEASDKDAEFQFARLDPVRIDFEENRVLITMNLASLKIGGGKRWKKVSMTAAYVPQRDGMGIKLVQDDQGTLIRGHRLRFRDRATIGTIHKVLFKRDYEFPVLPAKFVQRIGGNVLEISQLVVSDGWASISIDDQRYQQPQISERPLRRVGFAPRLFERR